MVDLATVFANATELHRAGNLAEAERLYSTILTARPEHSATLHRLGVIAHMRGRLSEAEKLILQAIRHDNAPPDYFNSLGSVQKSQARIQEAIESYRQAIVRKPDMAEAYNNLGNALRLAGDLSGALEAYQSAIGFRPNLAEAYNNMGNALKDLGRLDEAAAAYSSAIRLKPDYAQAHGNLGSALAAMERIVEASECFRKALSLNPGLAEVHANFGEMLYQSGDFDGAISAFRNAVARNSRLANAQNNLGNAYKAVDNLRGAVTAYENALAADPNLAEAHINLALVYCQLSDCRRSAENLKRALALRDNFATRSAFTECMPKLGKYAQDEGLQAYLVRALSEPWGNPEQLVAIAWKLLEANPDFCSFGKQVLLRWLEPLSSAPGPSLIIPSSVADNPLLMALLTGSPVCEIRIEKILTILRGDFLSEVAADRLGMEWSPARLRFYAALAQQCFINEFVFRCTEEELGKVNILFESIEHRLESKADIFPFQVVALAMYRPLNRLERSELLLERQWDCPIIQILEQQVSQPNVESQAKGRLARLTDIEDETSQKVRLQYEEAPYPRWVKVAPHRDVASPNKIFSEKFPFTKINPISPNPDILIAGCGTGRHAIETAWLFENAKILAVDLSLASLSYAMRKAAELNVPSIEFAQADLTSSQWSGAFDIIEAVGVLHHLDDLWAGWRRLLGMLRPNGVMKVGLYSVVGRKRFGDASSALRDLARSASADDVRRVRQEIIANVGQGVVDATTSLDFYSTSACRDLLFHVQEKRVRLQEIRTFAAQEGLSCLGFDVPPAVLQAYTAEFPNDKAAVDLAQWESFEASQPDIFSTMYQLWFQKRLS